MTFPYTENLLEQQRKRLQEDLLEIYEGSHTEKIKEELRRLNLGDEFQFFPINFLTMIIDSLSLVYIEPPKRTIDGPERDQKTFESIAETCALSSTMKDVAKLTKLLRTVLVRPVWANGEMRLDLWLPHLVEVETGDGPKDLQKITLKHIPESGLDKDTTYSIWTAETVTETDRFGTEISSEPNPYGVIPFVPMWDGNPRDRFWLNCGVRKNLLDAQITYNSQISSNLRTQMMQGFGTPVLTGADEQTRVEYGVGKAIKVPENGSFAYASPNAPIREIWETLSDMAKQMAVSNGVPASVISTDPTEESGIAKIVGNQKLMEVRADDVDRFRQYERNLFNMIRVVWNYHNPAQTISESSEFQIDFKELKKPVSETDRLAIYEFQMAFGLKDAADVLMDMNPDLTREEAEQHLLDRAAFSGKLANPGNQKQDFLEEA